jgi:uncharacterized protein (TIGR03437 family)
VLAGQTSVIVPYSVQRGGTTQMVVEYQGRRSDPVTLSVSDAAPALFSANSSGSGPGAILNADFSLNTAANPARKGSFIVLFGTGEGSTTPSGDDGSVAATIFPAPLLPVRVTIGGVEAQVLYAGAAPGLVAGVLQVNVVIPENAPAGNQEVVVIVGSRPSQAALTVAIEGSVSNVTSTPVTLTGAAGWPLGRTSNQLPPLAIDGDTSTFTWTTQSNNRETPSYLGVSFASTAVNRIRIFKDPDSGFSGPIAKDLTIEYTTSDPSVPLSSRVWIPVSGLVNGFQAAEYLTAASVNTNGTVTGDLHNSVVQSWASLTFNRVNATGLRIGFSNPAGTSIPNHYRVYELQAYNDAR